MSLAESKPHKEVMDDYYSHQLELAKIQGYIEAVENVLELRVVDNEMLEKALKGHRRKELLKTRVIAQYELTYPEHLI